MLIPQELLDRLNTAQDKLDEARARDELHAAAIEALEEAKVDESVASADALSAHQDASEAAKAAIEAIKKHFGQVAVF